jgi:hypothetical protein
MHKANNNSPTLQAHVICAFFMAAVSKRLVFSPVLTFDRLLTQRNNTFAGEYIYGGNCLITCRRTKQNFVNNGKL